MTDRRRSSALSWTEYQGLRFFDSLDGVRAVSVLLVITWHMPEKDLFGVLNGWAGVSSFFVLSGFLITTLALRAQRRKGAWSLRSFYTRRVYRILPSYFLVLAIFIALTATRVMPGWEVFREHLIYFFTLNVDLVRTVHMPFLPAWSLGVEEKFYVFWPLFLTAIIVWSSGRKLAAGVASLAVILGLNFFVSGYFGLYIGITTGCVLAFALDDKRWFDLIAAIISKPGVWVLTFGAAIAWHAGIDRLPSGSGLYSVFVAAALAVLLLIPTNPVARAFSSPAARWVGKRSYGAYLTHGLAIFAVDEMLPATESAGISLIRLVVALVVTGFISDLLHRTVEVPFIRRGHRRTAAMTRPAKSATPS